MRKTEDIAGVYAVLAEHLPSLWDGDRMLADMQVHEMRTEYSRVCMFAWDACRSAGEARGDGKVVGRRV